MWSIKEYAVYVIVFSTIYVFSHYFLGKLWLPNFETSKAEDIIMFLIITVFAVVQVITSIGLGLIVVLIFFLTYLLLNSQKQNRNTSLLASLHGVPRIKDVFLLFAMPVSSILVYSLYYFVRPRLFFVRIINFYGVYLAQFVLGFALLAWSVYYVLRRRNGVLGDLGEL